MDAQLDRFYEDIEFSVRNAFREYIVKVSQLNSSFFVLIKSYWGKILGDRQKYLLENLKLTTENIHREYNLKSKDFERDFFPYFKLVKSHGNYQFHSIFLKKDYVRNGRDCNKTMDA